MSAGIEAAVAARGAQPGPDGTVAGFGDRAAEYRAANESTALLWRPWRAPFRVRGADRLGFLQRILSNDIHAVPAGGGQRSLLLTPKGKVIGDLDLWVGDDEILAATAATAVDEVIGTLRRLVLRADVTIDDLRETDVVLGLVGPDADALLESLGDVPSPAPHAHGAFVVDGVPATLLRTPQLAAAGVELLVSSEGAGAVFEALAGRVRAAGGALVGSEVAELLRVEAGVPAHGAEITGEELPQELRLDEGIDYEKGCYVGQEPVARLHYRGHVNRLLYGLQVDAEVRPGWRVLAGDRDAGVVTSVVASPAAGTIGLGLVRRRAVEEGAPLTACAAGDAQAAGRTVETREIGTPSA